MSTALPLEEKGRLNSNWEVNRRAGSKKIIHLLKKSESSLPRSQEREYIPILRAKYN
jgi:hypothetical protein